MDYLQSKITEKQAKLQFQRLEKKQNKLNEVRLIYDMFQNVVQDYLYALINRQRESDDKEITEEFCVQKIQELIYETNESINKLNYVFNHKNRQILIGAHGGRNRHNKNWNWERPEETSKKLEKAIEANQKLQKALTVN